MIRLKHIRRAVPRKAQGLVVMFEDIDHLNLHKYHSAKNLTTTEHVKVDDIMTFMVLADMLKCKILLPGNGIFGNHFIIEYVWGSIIVVCELSKN
jgi:uncharacterized membrane protein YkvI